MTTISPHRTPPDAPYRYEGRLQGFYRNFLPKLIRTTARRRTWLLSRTRAQSTCILVAHLSYFWNTCGDLASISRAFCIRVRRIHRFRKSENTLARGGPRDVILQQNRRISRTSVQTKVLTYVPYSKPSLFIEEYVIFLRHGTACCVFGKSVYFSNTCAKYKYQLVWHIRNHHFPSKNTLYQGHAEKSTMPGQPASKPATQPPGGELCSFFEHVRKVLASW